MYNVSREEKIIRLGRKRKNKEKRKKNRKSKKKEKDRETRWKLISFDTTSNVREIVSLSLCLSFLFLLFGNIFSLVFFSFSFSSLLFFFLFVLFFSSLWYISRREEKRGRRVRWRPYHVPYVFTTPWEIQDKEIRLFVPRLYRQIYVRTRARKDTRVYHVRCIFHTHAKHTDTHVHIYVY